MDEKNDFQHEIKPIAFLNSDNYFTTSSDDRPVQARRSCKAAVSNLLAGITPVHFCHFWKLVNTLR